jgi:hypothetical protein
LENIQLDANCSVEEVETYISLFKAFYDILSWSYEEIPGIDPSIIVHEIKTYPTVKFVRQKLHPVHPKKNATIKTEVEKNLKYGFIYRVPLIERVSSIISDTKKHGTICVSVDYQDLNKACPKDNYPTPFITQFINHCVKSHFLYYGWISRYNQINIVSVDKHKTTFICPWGNFSYRKLPVGLKMLEPHFSGPCCMHSNISNILLNLTSMTYLLTCLVEETTLVTYDPYFFDVGFTNVD